MILQFATWPVRKGSMFTEAYGNRWSFMRPNEIAHHNGIDLSGGSDDILAVNKGVVSVIDDNPIYGSVVILEHLASKPAKVYSVYCHLAAIKVQLGQEVEAGEVIALMGGTGNYGKGYTKHLHFQVLWKLTDKWGMNDPGTGSHYDPLASLPPIAGSGISVGSLEKSFRTPL